MCNISAPSLLKETPPRLPAIRSDNLLLLLMAAFKTRLPAGPSPRGAGGVFFPFRHSAPLSERGRGVCNLFILLLLKTRLLPACRRFGVTIYYCFSMMAFKTRLPAGPSTYLNPRQKTLDFFLLPRRDKYRSTNAKPVA